MSTNNRPSKYGKWSQAEMQRAVELVQSGLSQYKVQAMTGIPRKTIGDAFNKKHQSCKPGRPTILSEHDEQSLAQYLHYMSKHNYPLTITLARAFATAIVQKRKSEGFNRGNYKDINTLLTTKWWRGFKKRHANEFALHKPDKYDGGRGRMANQTVIDRHFNTLKSFLEEHDLMNKPECLFNVD